MAVIRTNKQNDPFVRIQNDTIRDTNLSWEATGMLAWLLSHSDNFKISQERLQHVKTNGGSSTKRIILELRQKGYLHFVTLTKDGDGSFTGSIWDIFETPKHPDPKLKESQTEQFSRKKNNNFKDNDSNTHGSNTEGMDIEHANTEGMDNGSTLEEQFKNAKVKNDQSKNYYANSKICDVGASNETINIQEQIAFNENKESGGNGFISSQPKERKPDLLFEALAQVCGYDLATLNKDERGKLNKGLNSIKESGCTNPDDIRGKAKLYLIANSGLKNVTPNGLAGQWSTLGNKPKTKKRIIVDALNEDIYGWTEENYARYYQGDWPGIANMEDQELEKIRNNQKEILEKIN